MGMAALCYCAQAAAVWCWSQGQPAGKQDPLHSTFKLVLQCQSSHFGHHSTAPIKTPSIAFTIGHMQHAARSKEHHQLQCFSMVTCKLVMQRVGSPLQTT